MTKSSFAQAPKWSEEVPVGKAEKPFLTEVIIVGRSAPLEALIRRIAPGATIKKLPDLTKFCAKIMAEPLYEGTAVIINANGLGGNIDRTLREFDFLRFMAIVYESMDLTMFEQAGEQTLPRVLVRMFRLF